MSFIGRRPIAGNFQKCDAISTSSTATYNLTVGSTAVSPQSANHCLVSLNGVIQAPTSAYTIAGSTIVFNSSLTSSDVIDFILILGDVLDIGVPSDDTVGAAQINNNLISGTTALASTPADTDEFLVSDAGTLKRIDYSLIKGSGKIGQVVSTTLSTVTSTTSATFGDISGLAVSITPSATSSKVLVFVNLSLGAQAGYSGQLRLMRDSTAICIGTDSGIGGSQPQATFHQKAWNSTAIVNQGMNFLDSPSSTSSISYNVEWRETEETTLYLNRMHTTANSVSYPWVASTITAMEVLT
jgi:hypothetical protein